MSELLSDNEIRKLKMYTQGRIFFAAQEWERAYQEFHRLYSEDPNYEDVVKLCAEAALNNATRIDVPTSVEHQVGWLTKVIEVDPKHGGGRTQLQLDIVRYELTKELLGANKTLAAIEQIDRLSPRFRRRKEVQITLAGAYFAQGDYELNHLHLLNAIDLWKKALTIPQGRESEHQKQRRRAKRLVLIWDNHVFLLAVVGAIAVSCSAMWLSRGVIIGTFMPTPTMLALVTSTATVTSIPSETPRPPSSTFTATLIPTSSSTPAPSPVPTNTVGPTATATLRPTPTRTLTPTLLPTSTPKPDKGPIPMATTPIPTTPSNNDKPEPPCKKRTGC